MFGEIEEAPDIHPGLRVTSALINFDRSKFRAIFFSFVSLRARSWEIFSSWAAHLIHIASIDSKLTVCNSIEIQGCEFTTSIEYIRQPGDHGGIIGTVSQIREKHRHGKSGKRFSQSAIGGDSAADDHRFSPANGKRPMNLFHHHIDASRLETGGNITDF